MDLAARPEQLVSLRGISKHFVALLGPSGSGKTTLLNVIACILDPSEGTMSLEGEVVFDQKWLRTDLRRLRLDKIGFIFQSHNLLPFLNAIENVAIVLQLAGYDHSAARNRAVELLDYLEVGKRKNAFPAKLSGGEAQRVAIARALANRPRIILADEPTAALDSKRAQIVARHLEDSRQRWIFDKDQASATFHRVRKPTLSGMIACIPQSRKTIRIAKGGR